MRYFLLDYNTEAWWRAFTLTNQWAEGRVETDKKKSNASKPALSWAPLLTLDYIGIKPSQLKTKIALSAADVEYVDYPIAAAGLPEDMDGAKNDDFDALIGRSEGEGATRITSTGRAPLIKADQIVLAREMIRHIHVLERGALDILEATADLTDDA